MLRLLTLHVVAAYFIVHVDNIRFYDNLHTAWQLTLWSMHAAPVISFRLQPLVAMQIIPGLFWICVSLCCRRWRHAIRNPWSCSFIAIEAAALLVPLDSRFLSALLLLQGTIIGGFWLGMIAASFSETFTFLPLDRHLRRGLRHMLTSREAQRRLLHDMCGHGLQQILFAAALHAQPEVTWPPDAGTLVDTLTLVAVYACIVFVVCWMCPPHVLPYLNQPLRGRNS